MRKSLELFIVVSCLVACRQSGPLPDIPDLGMYKDVIIEISAPGVWDNCTRSVIPDPLRVLDIVDVFIYKDGALRRSLSFSRSSVGDSSLKTSSRLLAGDTYDIIVIANNTEHTAPATLDDALGMVYDSQGFTNLEEHGIPMCGMTTVTVTPNIGRINIVLKRLVAQVVFDIDKSGMTAGTIDLTSAKVCQMNTVCPFFDDGRATRSTEVSDGDYAKVEHMVYINAGWECVFFVLENKQGDLLPQNVNPDLKLPVKVWQSGGNPGLCTYVELSGVYTGKKNYLKGEPFVVRFFIGADACTNFDVNRNWRYLIHLVFTDDICFRNDWKLDFGSSLSAPFKVTADVKGAPTADSLS